MDKKNVDVISMGFSGAEKSEVMSFAENGCNWMEIMILNELSQCQRQI